MMLTRSAIREMHEAWLAIPAELTEQDPAVASHLRTPQNAPIIAIFRRRGHIGMEGAGAVGAFGKLDHAEDFIAQRLIRQKVDG